jgi:Xaa-Pro aminopeptidase
MCFTIEPGLYFKNTNSVYEGIGIRIEDVVLVTENGCEVLSNVPKEIDEIEAIRSLVV